MTAGEPAVAAAAVAKAETEAAAKEEEQPVKAEPENGLPTANGSDPATARTAGLASLLAPGSGASTARYFMRHISCWQARYP